MRMTIVLWRSWSFPLFYFIYSCNMLNLTCSSSIKLMIFPHCWWLVIIMILHSHHITSLFVRENSILILFLKLHFFDKCKLKREWREISGSDRLKESSSQHKNFFFFRTLRDAMTSDLCYKHQQATNISQNQSFTLLSKHKKIHIFCRSKHIKIEIRHKVNINFMLTWFSSHSIEYFFVLSCCCCCYVSNNFTDTVVDAVK